MNFWPRYAGPFFKLPPANEIAMCEARQLCMGIAAWAFSLHGIAIEPVVCCFDCVDDLAERAREVQIAIEVVRLQADLCQACGRVVEVGARHTIERVPVGRSLSHYATNVGPFCGAPCAMRWTRNPRPREGQS